MEEKQKIAARLKEFGIELCGEKHGWKKQFADKLDVSPAQMTNLLAGRDVLGDGILLRLSNLGADVDYIKTGRKKEEGPRHYEVTITRTLRMHGGVTARKIEKVVDKLVQAEKDDPNAFDKILDIIDTIFKKRT